MPNLDDRLLAAYDRMVIAYHRHDFIGHEAFIPIDELVKGSPGEQPTPERRADARRVFDEALALFQRRYPCDAINVQEEADCIEVYIHSRPGEREFDGYLLTPLNGARLGLPFPKVAIRVGPEQPSLIVQGNRKDEGAETWSSRPWCLVTIGSGAQRIDGDMELSDEAFSKLASWAALNEAALFKHWLHLTSSSEMYRDLKRLDGAPVDD